MSTGHETPRVGSVDEVWRGPPEKIDSRPAQRFPDLGPHLFKPVSFKAKAPFAMGHGISVPDPREFDGIRFKENIRAPPIAESFKANQLASPFRYRSPTVALSPSDAKFFTSSATQTGLPITDASQGPSEFYVVIKPDSIEVSPTQKVPEKSSRGSQPSAANLQSERALEHTPVRTVYRFDRYESDPELTGPLGLKNNNQEDAIFLRQLDSRLAEAAKAQAVDEPDKSEQQQMSKIDSGNRRPRSRSEPNPQTEPEPRQELEQEPGPGPQFKPGMNFGSPFGGPYYGKGI